MCSHKATGGMANQQDGHSPDLIRKAGLRLYRLAWQARLVLAVERLWPQFLGFAAMLAGLVGLSWLGVWTLLPPALDYLPFGLLGAACVITLWNLRIWRWPTQAEATARLDAVSGLGNRPASSFADRQADQGADAATAQLWQAHQARLARQIELLVRATPHADVPRFDPYALRHVGFLLLAMGVFAGGDDSAMRLKAALSPPGQAETGIAVREDGWIDPPAYTQVPPVMLDLQGAQHQSTVALKVPVGSRLVVRRSDGTLVKAEMQGGLAAEAADPAPKDLRLTLTGDARLTLHLQGRRDVTFAVTAIPDLPPMVTLTEPPKPDRKEGLGLSYHWEDDYGVASGSLEVIGAVGEDQRLETHPPLLPPPQFALSFGPDSRKGDGKTRLPIEEQGMGTHAWGGIEVEARIRVRDDAGQVGESEPIRLTLPQRPFTKPLARALVEQRKALIVNPSQALKIREAVLALMIAPELFTPRLGQYMGLERIERGLERKNISSGQYIQNLLDTADLMWNMAVAIEEDGLSQAERALQAAQNALKEAMDRGAPPEELKRLTDELRRAMDRALRELAEKMLNERNPDQQSRIDPKTMQMITPQDLKNLMDKMEEAMRRGDMAEAERLLEQLKNITRNMQAARPRSQQQSEMDKALDELDRMTREQQDLRDKTFREGQQGTNSDRQKKMQDLERNQQALRDRMEEMRRSMRQRGADQKEFGDAEDAMREAEGALGQGKDGEAVDAQGRALEAMRKGGEGLSRQMQQEGRGMGEGDPDGDPNQMADGPDSGQSGQQQADGQGNGDRDPLGRSKPPPDSQDRAKLNDDGSRTAAEERARSLIGELRRRLGEVARPQAEIDYLQRLLKDNGMR